MDLERGNEKAIDRVSACLSQITDQLNSSGWVGSVKSVNPSSTVPVTERKVDVSNLDNDLR